LLTRLKQKFQLKIARTAEKLWRAGLTPNMMSGLGVILALFSAVAYTWAKKSAWALFLAAALLLLSGLCDALDGAIARLYSQTTAFGGFIDSVLDRYTDAIIYSSIVVSGLCEVHWGLTALIGSLLVSYTRARAEIEGIRMETVGLMERPDRILIITIATFMTIYMENALNLGMILLAGLTNLTALQRIAYFYNQTRKD